MSSSNSTYPNRSHSPEFSDTLSKHLFINNVIQQIVPTATVPPATIVTDTQQQQQSPIMTIRQQEKDNAIRKSLEELSKDIKEIEDFITVTEDIIKRERERDREFYARERLRKYAEINERQLPATEHSIVLENKENKSPLVYRRYSVKSPTFKINRKKYRKKSSSPKTAVQCRSRLYFKNGRIGCVDAEENASNIQSTHELVKNIIKYENESPLVAPENVKKILCELGASPPLQLRCIAGSDDSGESADSRSSCDISGSRDDESFGFLNDDKKDNIEMNKLLATKCTFESGDSDNFDLILNEVNTPIIEDKMIVMDSASENNCNDEGRSIHSIDDEKVPKPGSSASCQSNVTLNSETKTQVRHLVRRFTARASKMRTRLDMPPTPSSSPSPPPLQAPTLAEITKGSKDSLSLGNRLVSTIFEADQQSTKFQFFGCPQSLCGTSDKSSVLDPQGRFYISWLCIVSLTFLYNAWVIPLRSSFPFQTPANTTSWLAADFVADCIYLVDVIFIKHRVMYLFEGFWVRDKTLTRKNYMRKLQFKMDILSLIPLDLFYLLLGTNAVFLRTPRLFKIQSFWEFFKLLDRVIASPHMVRVAKTLTYMLYMIHLTACTYYAYSDYQGLGTDRWVFSGKGHPYVRCFAFATKTATSIGKNPKPDTDGELLFMTAAWLMGVFVFALLIGQIRDIIATATRSQSEYRQLVDETLEYMRRLNLPADMQHRIKQWFQFTWEQQRTLDEGLILDYLPANLKTDIAISVHIQTLSKVQLFADCEEALLRELVLKLRSVTFLPGDYVCRKGEVGKEMYIVKVGQVQVMGGSKNDEVLATLSESSVFGEISLLAINGAEGNRRTADVKSKGFSNLFVLSKSDLNEAIVYYPNAQAVLKRRARTLMRKNAEREREETNKMISERVDVVIGNPTRATSPPRLLQTVIQALPDESAAAKLLQHGSKKIKKRKTLLDKNSLSEESFDTVIKIENEKEVLSNSLLEAIQKELDNKNKSINLTDSEKALLGPSVADETLDKSILS